MIGIAAIRLGAGTLPSVLTMLTVGPATNRDRHEVAQFGAAMGDVTVLECGPFATEGDHRLVDMVVRDTFADFREHDRIGPENVFIYVDKTNDPAYMPAVDQWLRLVTMYQGQGEEAADGRLLSVHRLNLLSEAKSLLNPRGDFNVEMTEFEGRNTLRKALIEATSKPPKIDPADLHAHTTNTREDTVLSFTLALSRVRKLGSVRAGAATIPRVIGTLK